MKITSLGGKSNSAANVWQVSEISRITVHCFGWYFKEIPVYNL